MSRLVAGSFPTFVGILLLLPVPAAAQSSPSLLVRGGPTFSDISVDDAEAELDTRTGIGLGAAIRWPLTDRVAVELGLGYVQKGVDQRLDAADGGGTVTLALDYVELPVLARVFVPTPGTLGVSFFGGPVPAFEVGCQIEGEGGGTRVSVDCDEFLEGVETSSTDLGLMLGAGVDVPVGDRVSLLVDASYTLGLTDIEEDEPGDAKNRTVAVVAGVSYRLGG